MWHTVALIVCVAVLGPGDGRGLAEGGQPPPARDLPALLADFQSPERALRKQAAIALHEMGADARGAVPELSKLSRGTDETLRYASLWVLTGIGKAAQEAVPTMIELLDHDDFHTQYWSCRVLAAVGLPHAEAAVPGLIACLNGKTASVRRNAALALGKLGPAVAPQAVAPLVTTLEDGQAAVREEAAIALGLLGNAASEASEPLQGRFQDASHQVRVASAVALWRVTGDSDSSLDLLLEELQGPNAPLQSVGAFGALGSAAAAAVDRLASLLSSPNAETRLWAALALGEIGPPAAAALPALERLKQDEDPDWREIAEEAIKKIRLP